MCLQHIICFAKKKEILRWQKGKSRQPKIWTLFTKWLVAKSRIKFRLDASNWMILNKATPFHFFFAKKKLIDFRPPWQKVKDKGKKSFKKL